MNKKTEQDYIILIEKVLAERANSDEFQALESAIIMEENVRELYLDLARQHSLLKQTAATGLVAPLTALPSEDEPKIIPESKSTSSTPSQLGLIVASIAAILILSFVLVKNLKPHDLPHHGTLTKSSSAQWGGCSIPTTLHSVFGAGQLELLQGTAEIKLHSGVAITLEAPVRFEIIHAMKTYIHYGTAIATVPDGAEGFRMDTPDLEVTDFGTVFAVSVDVEGESVVDVIQGEVEIYRPEDQHRERLTDNKKSWEISRQAQLPEEPHKYLSLSEGSGAFCSIIANNDQEHLHKNLLLVKHPRPVAKGYTRRAYLRFDLSNAQFEDGSSISLALHQVQSPFGLASFVPDCQFSVYMLHEETEWPSPLNWQTAPASSPSEMPYEVDRQKAKKIGSFTIPEGQQEGSIEVKLNDLELDDLQERRHLTLIVTRDTVELSSSGLAHAFTGVNSKNAQEPRLIIHN